MNGFDGRGRSPVAALSSVGAGAGGKRVLPPDRTEAILEAAKQVGSLLKAAGHDFALAGGVAAYAHGVPLRLSHDVDFCIRREDAEAVSATLEAAGVRVYTPPEDWLIKAECLGAAVDLIFELAHRPVESALLRRAPELPVNSVRMPVLSPSDLVASLVAAFSEHHCDYGPVLPIARQLREQIDWTALREELGERPMADAFFYLLERLDVIGPAARPGNRADAPRRPADRDNKGGAR